MDVYVVLSPAQRSIRFAEKFGDTSNGNHGNYHVISLKDLPEELNFGYLPNKALFYDLLNFGFCIMIRCSNIHALCILILRMRIRIARADTPLKLQYAPF